MEAVTNVFFWRCIPSVDTMSNREPGRFTTTMNLRRFMFMRQGSVLSGYRAYKRARNSPHGCPVGVQSVRTGVRVRLIASDMAHCLGLWSPEALKCYRGRKGQTQVCSVFLSLFRMTTSKGSLNGLLVLDFTCLQRALCTHCCLATLLRWKGRLYHLLDVVFSALDVIQDKVHPFTVSIAVH